MKKIIYIVVIFLLGIFVAYLSYNSNKYQHIYDTVSSAIKAEKYEEVAKTFGGCCDTNPIAKVNNEKVDVAVFNGTSISDLTYGEERSYSYEPTYYIYMFNVDYGYGILDGTKNEASILFEGENGQIFKYPFVLNSYVNTELIEKQNFTKETALFYSTRDITSNMETWDFMFVNVTKPMVEYITTQLGGSKIVGFTLTDNEGKVVTDVDANLDFSQKFYTDTEELIYQYNLWLTAYDKNENVKDAEEAFNDFYEPWKNSFDETKEQTGYTFPYDSKHLVPNKVLWKTVGYMAIYGAIMCGFYVLFFHFDIICTIFSRIFGRFKKKNKKTKNDTKETTPVVEEKMKIEEPVSKVKAENIIETTTEE